MRRYETHSLFNGANLRLGIELAIELWHRQGQPPIGTPASRSDLALCRYDAAYCLDAPEILPAGCCTVYVMDQYLVPGQGFVLRE